MCAMESMQFGCRRRSIPLSKVEKETVAALPLEKFNYSNCDFKFTLPFDATPSGSEGSAFDRMLLRRWNEAKRAGALQYDLNLLYKTLPGRFGLSAQLNMERATHRRKPHSFRSIDEPFDSRRFNFSKIRPEEMLLELCSGKEDNNVKSDHAAMNEDTSSGAVAGIAAVPGLLSSSQRSVIIVNNSPIEKGHSLLVPQMDKCLPQRLTFDGVKVALESMLLSGCRLFFMVYNSLLGHASVNHLHFHLYYWPYVSRIITWPLKPLCGSLYVLDSWLIPGFALQLQNNDVDGFARKVVALTEYLHQKSVAHNIFVARAPSVALVEQASRSGRNHVDGSLASQTDDLHADGNLHQSPLHVTVYIFPRKAVFGAKPTANFAPAACEFAGHLLIYTSAFFQAVHEARIVHIVEEEAYLENGLFEKLGDELRSHPTFNE